MSSAGKWTIEVTQSYPVWCLIRYHDPGREAREINLIRHNDLRDLAYAIERAIKQARDNLSEPYKHEMD